MHYSCFKFDTQAHPLIPPPPKVPQHPKELLNDLRSPSSSPTNHPQR